MATNALIQVQTKTGELAELVESVRDYAGEAKALRTRDAYRLDWKTFTAWCSGVDLTPLPAVAETVALYIAARADQGRKVSTIARELVSISQAHKMAGKPSPTSSAMVQEVMKGIR